VGVKNLALPEHKVPDRWRKVVKLGSYRGRFRLPHAPLNDRGFLLQGPRGSEAAWLGFHF
jgi:hypothetical protein